MNYVGYKWFDDKKTRRSADVLKMNSGENLSQFQKRCAQLGFEMVDGRNLVDHYKFLSDELIKGDLIKQRNQNISLLLVNIINDFNIASQCRAANCFGVKEVLIFDNHKFDRRGCTGSHNYLSLNYVKNLKEFDIIRKEFDIVVSIENCAGSTPLHKHVWDFNKKTLLIMGQESVGIPGEFLELSDHILEIKMKGNTERSLNVAQACSIALYDYNFKLDLSTNSF